MPEAAIPDNLRSLHDQEEALREKALDVVTRDGRLQLHLRVIEQAMDLADLLRQFPTEDEDLKVIQVLGMRTFNALGASSQSCAFRLWAEQRPDHERYPGDLIPVGSIRG